MTCLKSIHKLCLSWS